MKSKVSSSLTSVGSGLEHNQVIIPTRPSVEQVTEDVSTEQSDDHVRSLVLLILNEISKYEARSLDYRVFEPIVSDHPLHRLVSRLREIDPGFFMPGTNGKWQWRKVVQSSVVPSDTDYLKVFDELAALETLLFEHYILGSEREVKPNDISSLIKLTKSPSLDLNYTESWVLETIGNQPLRGKEIAKSAGYKYDTVRHVLPRLIKKGYVLKCKQGYVRCVNTCEHTPDTSQAQT